MIKQGYNTPEELRAVNRAVLEYILDYQQRTGFPPSRRDIAKHLDASPSTAQQALERLASEGSITLVPGVARGIRVSQSDE